MKTIDYSYFIERYNAGEMDHIEKRWFEMELNGNDYLRKELNLRKRVDNALIQHDLISLRNKLSILEKNRKEQTVAASGKKAIGIRFAAAIAALVIFGSLYFLMSGKNSPDTLFNRNFEVYSVNISSRSADYNTDLDFKPAFEQFSIGNYSEASLKLREYLKVHPDNMEAQFIYGISEMENTNYAAASVALGKVIDQDNNLYLDKAQWYISLCYLKTGNLIQASRQLDAIINSESIYKVKAKRLLKKIK